MSNMRIWDAVSKTDPKHTKGFKRAGGFQGTAIKPIWLTKRLTEQFGPAGSGWGMTKPEFQVVTAGDEILVYCTVGLWYTDGAVADNMVYGVGGDKVMGKNKYGPFTNDEAFKASYTDALSNAMKQIGMGADIHMGLFEDDKYLREVKAEFASGNNQPVDAHGHPHLAAAKEMEQRPIDAVDPADRDLVRKGEERSQYEVNKRKEAEGFVAKALQMFGGMQGSTEVSEWYKTPISPKGRSTNRDAVDRLKENFPDLGTKLETAADEVRLRNGARMQ
jgi:hypothetical protein